MANQSYPADNTWVNWADSDAIWGPLLFLRPKPAQYLSNWRIALIACVIGSFQGMALNAGMAIARRLTGHPILPPYIMPIVLSCLIAAVLALSVGRAWNRRAERLIRRQSR